MNNQELENTLNSIIELGNQLRAISDLDDRAVPSPAASKADVQSLRTAIPDIPPSLLRLLSIYDGIESFEWADISFRGCKYLKSNPDLERSWVEAGAAAPGELLIFGESESDADVVAFLRSTARSDGEMEVVNFDSDGEIWRYPDLETCLAGRLEWFKQSLAAERADRANLSDDE